MKQQHKIKQCKGCSYGRTPADMDRCNYCGELFSISDNATVDVHADAFNGIKVADIDILKFPKGMTKNKDTTLFLEVLKKESNVATCKIYRLEGNLESFYAILSGNIYLTIHEFLKKAPHLRIFNVYTDMSGIIDLELDKGEDVLPIGVFSVCFDKMDRKGMGDEDDKE